LSINEKYFSLMLDLFLQKPIDPEKIASIHQDALEQDAFFLRSNHHVTRHEALGT